jgi:hypothetical protein
MRRMLSDHLAFDAPDLISQVRGVLRADHDRRAGTRSPGVHEAAHTAPYMPLWEFSRVGPPVRNVIARRSPTPWEPIFVHRTPPPVQSALWNRIEQSSTDQSRCTT